MDVTGGAIRRWRGRSRRELRSMARSGMRDAECRADGAWHQDDVAAMGADQFGGDGKPEAGAARQVEPWNASNMCARALSETPGPVSDTSITTTLPSRRPVMRIWSRAGSRAPRACSALHGVARDVDQHAEKLVVVGLDREPALDRDDPADRHVERQAERLVHFLDQRLDLDGLALGRRLLRRAVRQRRLAERDGALERAHQLGREALHLGVGQASKAGRRKAAPRRAGCANRD